MHLNSYNLKFRENVDMCGRVVKIYSPDTQVTW